MAIIYPDETAMLSNKSIISERVDFAPEIYIYIQKLVREQDKTFNEIVNDIIRKDAEDSIVKHAPITYPIVQPYTPYYKYEWYYTPSTTCKRM